MGRLRLQPYLLIGHDIPMDSSADPIDSQQVEASQPLNDPVSKGLILTGTLMLGLPLLLSVVAIVFPSLLKVLLPECSLYKWTGIYCSGCGGTRMAKALLHGHIREAIGHNMFLFMMMPVYVVSALHFLIKGKTGRNLWPWRMRWYIWIFIILLGLVFSIIRNLDNPLGHWLAP